MDSKESRYVMFEGMTGYYSVAGGLFEDLDKAEMWCIKNKVPMSMIEFMEVM